MERYVSALGPANAQHAHGSWGRPVYATNRYLSANDVGRRLENLFWRIWGNRPIQESIRGRQIAALFGKITEAAIIRTTPTSSPRTSRASSTTHTTTEAPTEVSPAQPQVKEDDDDEEDGRAVADMDGGQNPSPTVSRMSSNQRRVQTSRAGTVEPATSGVHQPPTIEEEKGRRRGSSRPPPILKKTRVNSGTAPSKSARILAPTWKDDQEEGGEDEEVDMAAKSQQSLRPSETLRTNDRLVSSTIGRSAEVPPENAANPSRNDRPSSAKTGTTGKKKAAAFVVGATSSKRRPTIGRRKSSQSSGNAASARGTSPRLGTPTAFRIDPPPHGSRVASGEGAPQQADPATVEGGFQSLMKRSTSAHSSRPTSRSTSPQSSGPFHRPSRDHVPESTDWLVDRDFRSKFAGRSQTDQSPLGSYEVAPPSSGSGSGPAALFRNHRSVAFGSSGTAVDNGCRRRERGWSGREAGAGSPAMLGLASSAVEDDEHPSSSIQPPPTGTSLPRTTSQLTLLLARERHGGGRRGNRDTGRLV